MTLRESRERHESVDALHQGHSSSSDAFEDRGGGEDWGEHDGEGEGQGAAGSAGDTSLDEVELHVGDAADHQQKSSSAGSSSPPQALDDGGTELRGPNGPNKRASL